MSRRVLLTGATGFVGSRVAAAYATDHELRCTVRETSDTRWIDGLKAEQVVADVRDPADLERALEGVELVVHVAGITTAADEDAFYAVNTEGTLSLAKGAAEGGVERFVFMSSLAARGPDPPGSPPGAEVADDPVSLYGTSKLAAEDRLRGFRDRMEVVVLRPGGVYGPRDRDLLPLFRAAARGFLPVPASDTLLQPIYVADVARATVLAGENGCGYGPHDLVQRGRYTWEEMAAHLSEAVGRRVRVAPIPPGLYMAAGFAAEFGARLLGVKPAFDRRRARDLARHRWTADPGPAERALGWEPHVSLAEGFRRTVRWYREHGWL